MLQEGVNQNLVFVDEAGFNLYIRRTRGRASIGQRAVRQMAGSRGKNLNIIIFQRLLALTIMSFMRYREWPDILGIFEQPGFGYRRRVPGHSGP